jgi:outer membrane receptor for Fe3+-dicitrate
LSRCRDRLQLGVKNITDATYFSSALSAGGYVGQPRTVFVKANRRF